MIWLKGMAATRYVCVYYDTAFLFTAMGQDSGPYNLLF